MTEEKKSEDEWVMSAPTEKKVSDFLVGDNLGSDSIDLPSSEEDSSLESELANWGMEIPPSLSFESDKKDDLEFPSVIEEDLIEDEQALEKNMTDYSISNNESTEAPNTKPSDESILDHLGKNFFDGDEDLTSEHSIESLVDGNEDELTAELKPELQELSSALSGDMNDFEQLNEKQNDGDLFPDSADLDYPDLTNLDTSTDTDKDPDDVILPDNVDLAYPGEEDTTDAPSEPTSKLISADELADDTVDLPKTEETDPLFNITQEIKNDLAQEIESDGDVDPDDFWATDDFPKIKKTLNKPITEVQASKQIKEDFFKDIDNEDNFKIIPSKRFSSITLDEVAPTKQVHAEATAISEDIEQEIVEKVKSALTPALEQMVRDLLSEKIEKIAWEVIPDLAENIIKKEVEEIARHVYLSKDSEKDN